MNKLNKKSNYIVYLITFIVFGCMLITVEASDQLPEGVVIKETFEAGNGLPVGKVLLVQGDVLIIHGDTKQGFQAKNDLPLFEGDIIVTREKGNISFQLNDGSTLTLTSNTQVVINRSVYDQDKKSRSSFLNMSMGKARIWVKKLLDFKNSEFKIKTKTAVVGVRGSDYVIEAAETYTKVTALDQTKLEVISMAAPEAEPVMLVDFQQTVVEAGKLPSTLEAIPRVKIEEMKKEFIIIPGWEETIKKEPPVPIAVKGIMVPANDLVKPGGESFAIKPPEHMPLDAVLKHEVSRQEGIILDQKSQISEDRHEITVIQERKQALPSFPGTPN